MKACQSILVIAVAALILVPTVKAQNSGPNWEAKLLAELERTDQVIERARDLISNASSARAALALQQATQLQQQAWEAYRNGGTGSLLTAYQLTRQAREKASFALANGQIADQTADAVLRKLERIEDLLQRASDRLSDHNAPSLSGVYESVRANLDKAWELYRAEQFRPAVKLANQIERVIQRVIEEAERSANSAANYERRLAGIEEMWLRVEYQLRDCNSETARILVEQAKLAFEQAKQLARKGQYPNALRALLKTRELLQDALEECRAPETLQSRHARIEQRLNHFSETVPADDDAARRLINQASEQLELAARFIRKNNTEAAAAALRAAELALQQAEKRYDWDEL